MNFRARGRHLEHMLAHYVPPARKSHIVRFQSDQRASASTFLARTLWLQGLPDQAMRTAESTVDDFRSSDHIVSLCNLLAHGPCAIALWTGDLSLAERYVGLLNSLSTRYSLTRWGAIGRSCQGVLAVRAVISANGMQLLRSGFDELGHVSASFRLFVFLCGITEALIRVARGGGGLSELEGVIGRADETEERWGIAELLRVKGELLLLQGVPGAVAEDHFRQALDWARRQGALSWELRAATSLAQLLRDQGRTADGGWCCAWSTIGSPRGLTLSILKPQGRC